MLKVFLIWALIAFFVGCGANGGEWLARSSSGTVTVSSASTQWSRLDQTRRDYFLQADSPGEEFVTSLAMLEIVGTVAEREGYTSDPVVRSFRDSWLRTEAFIAWSAGKHDELVLGFAGEDLRYFAEHSADTVWITLSGAGRGELDMGFLRLPELPAEVADALLETPAGSSIPFRDGSSIRLERISRGVSSPALPDSTQLWAIAQGRLRFLNLTDGYLAHSAHRIAIDTSVVIQVSRYFAGALDAPPADTVLSSSLLTLTGEELARELDFFQTRLPVRPWETQWVMMTIDNVIIQTLRMTELAEIEPVLLDSLAAGADRFGMELAVSAMFADSVTAMLSLTEEDIIREYDLLEEAVIIPERRVLLALHVPEGISAGFRAALEAGSAEDVAEGLQGLPFLFGGGPVSRVTPPLTFEELPYGHREQVFALAPGDTAWLGPFEMDHMPGFAVYRLIDVVPEHVAEPWEIMPQLRTRAIRRAEALRIHEWMGRLKEEFGFSLNHRALKNLPDDPGLWATPRER